MKHFLILLAVTVTVMAGCTKNYYGTEIDDKDAITVQELKKRLAESPRVQAKVVGQVKEVCQKEGCWLTMDYDDSTEMQVRMKDHDFFVPRDISGRTAVIQGEAYMDTTSVEDLRHYAEDAGKTKEEIEAIKEPVVEPVFEAEGVLLK